MDMGLPLVRCHPEVHASCRPDPVTRHGSCVSRAMANEEEQSRQVAEAAREREWKKQSFLRDLFLGSFRLDLVHPLSTSPVLGRPAYAAFHARLKALLHDLVDPVAIDESGEYPQEVLTALARLGAFGMKIPTEYGGLGFTQREYEHAMELVGSYDANVTALL